MSMPISWPVGRGTKHPGEAWGHRTEVTPADDTVISPHNQWTVEENGVPRVNAQGRCESTGGYVKKIGNAWSMFCRNPAPARAIE